MPSAYLHVFLQLTPPDQVVRITLDGHVVQAQQAVKTDAVRLLQLLLVGILQHRLAGSCTSVITPCSRDW